MNGLTQLLICIKHLEKRKRKNKTKCLFHFLRFYNHIQFTGNWLTFYLQIRLFEVSYIKQIFSFCGLSFLIIFFLVEMRPKIKLKTIFFLSIQYFFIIRGFYQSKTKQLNKGMLVLSCLLLICQFRPSAY